MVKFIDCFLILSILLFHQAKATDLLATMTPLNDINLTRCVLQHLDEDDYKQATLVSKHWLKAARHQPSNHGLFTYTVYSESDSIPYDILLPIRRVRFLSKDLNFLRITIPKIVQRLAGLREIVVLAQLQTTDTLSRLPIRDIAMVGMNMTWLPLYPLFDHFTNERRKFLSSLTSGFTQAVIDELKVALEKRDLAHRWALMEAMGQVIKPSYLGNEVIQIIKAFEDVKDEQIEPLVISLNKLGEGLKGMSKSRLITYIKEHDPVRMKQASPDMRKLLSTDMAVEDRIEICDNLVDLSPSQRRNKVIKTLQQNGGRAVSPRIVIQTLKN